MRLNVKVVEAFLTLQKSLPQVIEAYGLKHSVVYQRAGISRATYYRKLNMCSFDGEETLRICDAVNR